MEYQKLLEEIKSKLNIVEFISEYVNLTKTGQNYKALCPFHSEKTPSFFVSPSKQIFHCFGCGKGGDIVTFVMEYENVSFHEALSVLAAKAGIEFRRSESLTKGTREILYKIYEVSANFFAERLRSSERARRYLFDRGIRDETVEQFRLGYAPDERDELLRFLKNQGFDDRSLGISGLVSRGVDFFRNRIIIPIYDLSGRIVAFGGRLLGTSEELPKYVNSPDTPIFKKGENLFGLFQAKQSIKQKGYAVLMEGYIDVIMSHQFGFKNSVAPLGTSLNLEQLRRLRRFTEKVVVAFDGDEAGVNAAKRSLPLLFQAGFIVKIARLPNQQDPASLLKNRGEREFKIVISKALSPVDFMLNTSSKRTKSETVRESLESLSHIKNLIYRDELIKELAEKSGVSEISLREELKRNLNKDKINLQSNHRERKIFLSEEETLLKIALFFPESIESIFSKISLDLIENSTVREILYKLKGFLDQTLPGSNTQIPIERFFNYLSEEEKKLLSELIIAQDVEPDSIGKNLDDCIKRIKLKIIDNQIRKLSKSADEKYLQALIRQKREILGE